MKTTHLTAALMMSTGALALANTTSHDALPTASACASPRSEQNDASAGASAQQARPISREAVGLAQLRSGRRMLPLRVEGATLVGRSPKGEGAPFRILSGSEVLWEGGADQPFRVSASHLSHLYLLSEGARNLDWQQLAWEGSARQADEGASPTRSITLKAADEGLHAGQNADAGPVLRRLLSKARALADAQNCAVTIELEPGEYHLHREGSLPVSIYTSNHDQQEIHPVGLPLIDLHDITLDGKGSRIITHGLMMPALVMDCKRVTLKGLRFDQSTPFYSEGRIVDISDKGTTLEMTPESSWTLENGEFCNCGPTGASDGPAQWINSINHAIAFHPDGRMVPTGESGDISWSRKAEQVGERRLLFPVNAAEKKLSVGDILTLRSYWRPHPCMVIYRGEGITLDDVVFHDSMGMALIAQRSGDITIRGGGCIRKPGFMHTASADATHFSNCRGHIDVSGALYEGMMDDAINVHSTSLEIEEVLSPTEIICRYRHPQAIGFEVLQPGEAIQFIHGPTLQNTSELNRAVAVAKTDETHLRITLEKPLSEGIGVGDAFENADWYPSVTFRGNTVRHNRARGALFTTPKPILVEGNRFIWSSGSAILLAGDAQGWYESGRCLNLTIRNNVFDHNLTNNFGYTEGIISIYPEVRRPEEQTERYHRNILIENNTFLSHRVPLVFAISAQGLRFRDNKVVFDDLYTPMHDGQPFVFLHCEDMETQPLDGTGSQPDVTGATIESKH